jgi:hypothetical protein
MFLVFTEFWYMETNIGAYVILYSSSDLIICTDHGRANKLNIIFE